MQFLTLQESMETRIAMPMDHQMQYPSLCPSAPRTSPNDTNNSPPTKPTTPSPLKQRRTGAKKNMQAFIVESKDTTPATAMNESESSPTTSEAMEDLADPEDPRMSEEHITPMRVTPMRKKRSQLPQTMLNTKEHPPEPSKHTSLSMAIKRKPCSIQ